jgi:hypothetical protein
MHLMQTMQIMQISKIIQIIQLTKIIKENTINNQQIIEILGTECTQSILNNIRFLAHRLIGSGLSCTIGFVNVLKPSSTEQRAEFIAEAIHSFGNCRTSVLPSIIWYTKLQTDLKGHNKLNDQIMQIIHIMQIFTCTTIVLKPIPETSSNR